MSSRPDNRTHEPEVSRTETDADRVARPRGELRAVVVYEQNARGAMTLRDDETNATYQVVEYAVPDVRTAASRLDPGTMVEVDLERIGCRANVWRARALTGPTE